MAPALKPSPLFPYRGTRSEPGRTCSNHPCCAVLPLLPPQWLHYHTSYGSKNIPPPYVWHALVRGQQAVTHFLHRTKSISSMRCKSLHFGHRRHVPGLLMGKDYNVQDSSTDTSGHVACSSWKISITIPSSGVSEEHMKGASRCRSHLKNWDLKLHATFFLFNFPLLKNNFFAYNSKAEYHGKNWRAANHCSKLPLMLSIALASMHPPPTNLHSICHQCSYQHAAPLRVYPFSPVSPACPMMTMIWQTQSWQVGTDLPLRT